MKKEDEKNVNGVEETQVAESAAEPVAEENAVGAETAVSAETESAAVRSDEANGEAKEEDFFSPKEPSKKKKRIRRKDMTPEQRRVRRIKDIIITCSVFGVVLLFFAICAICSYAGYNGNFKYIASLGKIDYDSPYTPTFDKDLGYTVFTTDTDKDFRVLQLTDVHVGAGAFSAAKDRWALDAVRTVIDKTKPDLVIVTGDIAYPVPFQAGTFNNMREAEMFASLMEELGVYWTMTFGNHDTEIYSLYDRDQIGDFYENEKWTYCLFNKGPEDLPGCGNDMILVKNKEGKIIQSFVMLDSHSYVEGSMLGISWNYDNIKKSQTDWYASEIDRLTAVNADAGYENPEVKNCVFFHIPLTEYGEYWSAYRAGADNVKKLFGKAGEDGEKSYPGQAGCETFETMAAHYGQGAFCGHDHYNTYSLEITLESGKKIRLTYGMSIDYLAYIGIAGHIEQRGGTEIKINHVTGDMTLRQQPYQGAKAGEFV